MGHEVAETEVTSRPRRRQFTAAYRRRIVREAEACTEAGAIGALLRREGLYSSHLSTWRREVAEGELAALANKKRGPKPKHDERDRLIAAQAREIEKLKARLERTELVCEIQKKVSSILGVEFPPLPLELKGSR